MGERVPDDATASRPKGLGGTALEDYAALEAVLIATPRGRCFLSEYARQNRRAEIGMLLGAMSKLEAAVLGEQGESALHVVFVELAEISEAIVRARCAVTESNEVALDRLSAMLDSISQRINALIEIWKAGESEAKADDAEGPRQPSNEPPIATDFSRCQA